MVTSTTKNMKLISAQYLDVPITMKMIVEYYQVNDTKLKQASQMIVLGDTSAAIQLPMETCMVVDCTCDRHVPR